MEHQDLAQTAAVLGAVGAPMLLLARDRLILLAGMAVVLVAEIALIYALVPDAPGLVAGRPFRLAAAVVAGFGVLTLAALFVRFPAAAPVTILAAAPFRVTVSLGSEKASLLIPLYIALGAGTAALAYRAVHRPHLPAIPLLVAAPASALIGLAGISLLWAHDLRAGTIELVFFYFPFAGLLTVVARTRPPRWAGRALSAALLALAGIFAAIGIYQAWTHTSLLAKEDVQVGNAYTSFFRVTSLFEDPNVYARHLVLAMVVLLTLLWFERLRPAVGIPLMLLFVTGLYFSYSQTSLVALFAAVLVVGLVAGDKRTRQVLAAIAVGLALAAGALVVSVIGGESARQVTSDRIPLARITLPVYRDHPIAGVGIGSQPLVSRREEDARGRKSKNVSHTTPLTVAAELGTLGLLVYTAFLVGLGRALLLTSRRDHVFGLALAGCLTALVVHSVFYGAFFEDPVVWGLAGLAAAMLALRPQEVAETPRPGRRRVPARAEPVSAQPPGSAGR